MKEEPDDQRGEQGAFDNMLLQRIDDFEDIHGVVRDNMQLHAGRELRPQFVLYLGLDLVDNGNGVGIGYLDDTETDCGFTIETGQLTIVGQAIDDFSNILQLHWCSGFPADHHLFQGVDRVEFEIKFDQAFRLFADDETAGHLHVLLVESLVDVLRGNTEGCHAGG